MCPSHLWSYDPGWVPGSKASAGCCVTGCGVCAQCLLRTQAETGRQFTFNLLTQINIHYVFWEFCIPLTYQFLFLFLFLLYISILLPPSYFLSLQSGECAEASILTEIWQCILSGVIGNRERLTKMWEEIMSHNVQFKNESVCASRRENIRETWHNLW